MIRPATAADHDAVLALATSFATSFAVEADAFRRSWDALLADNGCALLVAGQEGVVVGYLLGFRHQTFFANGPVGWVEEVMVDDSQRRGGVGQALMQAFESWARESGCSLVALATRRADAFYRAMGYEESATYFRKLL